jgi:capsular exopolysaccharide synthesis family protein
MTELRVVVVDANLKLPQLYHLFGVQQENGLTDALDIGSVRDYLKQVESPGIKLLTSGRLHPDPGGLLGSARMKILLEELKEQADIVLIDCPPILPVADTILMAPNVDGIVLVFCANQTREQDAVQALESIRSVNANVIGTVLNNVPCSKKIKNDYSQGEKKKRKFRFAGILSGVTRKYPKNIKSYAQLLILISVR